RDRARAALAGARSRLGAGSCSRTEGIFAQVTRRLERTTPFSKDGLPAPETRGPGSVQPGWQDGPDRELADRPALGHGHGKNRWRADASPEVRSGVPLQFRRKVPSDS